MFKIIIIIIAHTSIYLRHKQRILTLALNKVLRQCQLHVLILSPLAIYQGHRDDEVSIFVIFENHNQVSVHSVLDSDEN